MLPLEAAAWTVASALYRRAKALFSSGCTAKRGDINAWCLASSGYDEPERWRYGHPVDSRACKTHTNSILPSRVGDTLECPRAYCSGNIADLTSDCPFKLTPRGLWGHKGQGDKLD